MKNSGLIIIIVAIICISILIFVLLKKKPAKFNHLDWANLKKYQTENLNIDSSKSKVNRVVFMGNSITEFWNTHQPYFFKNPLYINRGISGQTTPQMLLRFKQDVIDLEPEIVVILAGVNDIAENTGPTTQKMIEDNIFSMAQLAKTNGIKVILCSVLPVFSFQSKKHLKPANKVIALNAALKEYTLKNDIFYLDYYSSMVDAKNGLKEAYTYDGLHPNAEGYKIMAPLAEEAIKITLNKN